MKTILLLIGLWNVSAQAGFVVSTVDAEYTRYSQQMDVMLMKLGPLKPEELQARIELRDQAVRFMRDGLKHLEPKLVSAIMEKLAKLDHIIDRQLQETRTQRSCLTTMTDAAGPVVIGQETVAHVLKSNSGPTHIVTKSHVCSINQKLNDVKEKAKFKISCGSDHFQATYNPETRRFQDAQVLPGWEAVTVLPLQQKPMAQADFPKIAADSLSARVDDLKILLIYHRDLSQRLLACPPGSLQKSGDYNSCNASMDLHRAIVAMIEERIEKLKYLKAECPKYFSLAQLNSVEKTLAMADERYNRSRPDVAQGDPASR